MDGFREGEILGSFEGGNVGFLLGREDDGDDDGF